MSRRPVPCSICGVSIPEHLLSEADLEAEEHYCHFDRDDRKRITPLASREWYCSMRCVNVERLRLVEAERLSRSMPPESPSDAPRQEQMVRVRDVDQNPLVTAGSLL